MPDRCMIDTNVLAYFLKSPRDSRAALYTPYLHGKEWLISFVTYAELLRWPRERGWGRARTRALEHYLQDFTIAFADRGTCETWATTISALNQTGHSIEANDGWIAASARHLGLPLVTHNRRHFAHIPDLIVISAAP